MFLDSLVSAKRYVLGEPGIIRCEDALTNMPEDHRQVFRFMHDQRIKEMQVDYYDGAVTYSYRYNQTRPCKPPRK